MGWRDEYKAPSIRAIELMEGGMSTKRALACVGLIDWQWRLCLRAFKVGPRDEQMIYDRWILAREYVCDQCDEPGERSEFIARKEMYQGVVIILRWCSQECLDEWNRDDADSETGGMTDPDDDDDD